MRVILIAAAVIPALFLLIQTYRSDRLEKEPLSMLLGLVLVPLISLVTPKPDRAVVDNAFSCYDVKVLVRQTSALEDEK